MAFDATLLEDGFDVGLVLDIRLGGRRGQLGDIHFGGLNEESGGQQEKKLRESDRFHGYSVYYGIQDVRRTKMIQTRQESNKFRANWRLRGLPRATISVIRALTQ